MPTTDNILQTYMQQETKPPCISIFIPTHPKSTSQRINEDRIRLKNNLQNLEEQDIFSEEFSVTHKKLLDLLEDSEFWIHQSRSLAVFANPDGIDTIHLPYELTTAMHTGDKYALSPLLIMQNTGHDYYLIDIDFKQPRLYTGTANGLEELSDIKLPDGIIEQENIHDTTDIDADQIHNIKRYLHRVAEQVSRFLGQKSVPLFVIGSPKWTSEFRSLMHYEHVMPDDISSSYNRDKSAEQHQTISNKLSDITKVEKTQLIERYHDMDPSLRADGLTAVESAADQGKVDTLILPVIRVTTDGIDSSDSPRPLIELPEDFTSFDTAVRKVAEQSGIIVPIDQAYFADNPTMKAILRY